MLFVVVLEVSNILKLSSSFITFNQIMHSFLYVGRLFTSSTQLLSLIRKSFIKI